MTPPAILEASRWWCGRMFARGADALSRTAAGRDGPIGPLLVESRPWPGTCTLRWPTSNASCSAAGPVSSTGTWRRGPSGQVAFADHEPAWRWSAYHSVDIQIAAADADAVRRGDFLIVLGDFHGGGNPLVQGLFAHRHPQPGTIAARIVTDIGPREAAATAARPGRR